jgi:hypothetical protein
MSMSSKIRKGYNLTNPTQMKSDGGKGTDLNSSPAVKVRSTGTSGWEKKQPKTDAGTAAVGGKMDKGTGLSTWGKVQPKTDKGTSTYGKTQSKADVGTSGWSGKQTKKDFGTAGNTKVVKTNFPLAKG